MANKHRRSADLRKGILPVLGIVCLLTLLASCKTMQASNLQQGPSINDYQIVGSFEKTIWLHKFLGVAGGPTLFNLFSDVSDEKIQTVVRQEIQNRGGTSAINIKIQYKAGIGPLLLNFITLMFYAPSEVTVSGTIIKEK